MSDRSFWIINLLALLLLVSVSIHSCVSDADAEMWTNSNKDHPALEFDRSETHVWLRVFRFYDTQFRVLCYATSNSLDCIPYGDLTLKAKNQIKKKIEQANKYEDAPIRIIKLP